MPRERTSSTSTAPAPDYRGRGAQVVPGQWVSSLAHSLFMIQGRWGGAPQHIDSMCDRFLMRRINTDRASAEVVALETGRDDLNEHLVSNTMGIAILTSVAKHSVALIIFSAGPIPTRIAVVEMLSRYFNFGKETSENFTVEGQSVRILVGHIFSLISKNVISPGLTFTASVRAFFILPYRSEVCYR